MFRNIRVIGKRVHAAVEVAVTVHLCLFAKMLGTLCVIVKEKRR